MKVYRRLIKAITFVLLRMRFKTLVTIETLQNSLFNFWFLLLFPTRKYIVQQQSDAPVTHLVDHFIYSLKVMGLNSSAHTY